MAEKRATKEEKEEYKINPNREGNWSGKCPECDMVFEATHSLVSQIGVIRDIRKHQREEHNNKHFTSSGETISMQKPRCKVWGCMYLDYMPEMEMCHIHHYRVSRYGSPFGYLETGRKQQAIDNEKRRAEKIMRTCFKELNKEVASRGFHIPIKIHMNLETRRQFISFMELNNIKLPINVFTGEHFLDNLPPTPEPIVEKVEEVEIEPEQQLPLEETKLFTPEFWQKNQEAINSNMLSTIDTMMGFIAEMAGQINTLNKKVDELERKQNRENPLADLREQIRGRGISG